MALFLGVDGGQSSTVALIGDESGRVLGAGRGGPCNHVAAAEGRAKFSKAIHECIGEACSQAGLIANDVVFTSACLGFSGGSADKEAYSREFIRSREFKITHDAEIAMTGATGGAAGIIVIAGTGSIAWGKNAEGKSGRAGGWGYVFGDEGGAFDLVRQALRVSLAMEEGWGRPTELRRMLLEQTGASTANALMHDWYNQFDRKNVAQFAPVIDAAARDGDAVAIELMQTAGEQLAELVGRVYGMLFQSAETALISFVGGAFESILVTEALRSDVERKLSCPIMRPLFPPAAGALLEALRLAAQSVKLSAIPEIKT